jgi:transcriptional regulator with XRE-family HTH domain
MIKIGTSGFSFEDWIGVVYPKNIKKEVCGYMSSKKFDISDRLKEIMGEASQREFAKSLNISPSTLWEYLNGRIPPADFIIRVCETYRICEHWLLTGQGGRDLLASGITWGVGYHVNKSKTLEVREAPGPEYGKSGELSRLHDQVTRIYHANDKSALDKLRGFLSALDPGKDTD